MSMLGQYEVGKACHFGEAVGRIVGPDEGCEQMLGNGVMTPSIILWRTPHGTVIRAGIMHFSPITPEGTERLLAYESEVVATGACGSGSAEA